MGIRYAFPVHFYFDSISVSKRGRSVGSTRRTSISGHGKVRGRFPAGHSMNAEASFLLFNTDQIGRPAEKYPPRDFLAQILVRANNRSPRLSAKDSKNQHSPFKFNSSVVGIDNLNTTTPVRVESYHPNQPLNCERAHWFAWPFQ